MTPRRATIGWTLAMLLVGGIFKAASGAHNDATSSGDRPPAASAAEATPLLRAFTSSEPIEVIQFSLGEKALPAGGHIQGLQLRSDPARDRDLLFLSHDSNTQAYFVVAAIAKDDTKRSGGSNRVLRVQPLPTDGKQPPLRHAGGIQLSGDILAVGVEDNQAKLRSEVQFWNVANPEKPVQLNHLTITRVSDRPKEMTAGAVGIVRQEMDYLIAVANWDARRIDFYQSTGKQLEDPECRFRRISRWDAPASSTRPRNSSGAYQAINLFSDEDHRLYLLGFETNAAQQDLIELLSVHVTESGVELRPLARRQVKLSGNHHFRYGAGASKEGQRWTFFGSPATLAPETAISRLR